MSTDPATTTSDVTVVVLAGGTSRRFGADKLGARLHGSTVLETVRELAARELARGRRRAAARLRPPGHLDP